MRLFDNLFLNRVLHKSLWLLLLPLCALWGAVQTVGNGPPEDTPEIGAGIRAEFPAQWNGATLRPLALSEVEHRFAQRFPGTIARLTDGRHVLVLRTVHRPTRMLHPAADCYKGLGYRISDERLEAMTGQARWRCFIAERGGQQLRVCERIEDAQGQTFTDTSAWYWAAVAGKSTGPWQAVTVARPL